MFRTGFDFSINVTRHDKWPADKLAEGTIRFRDGLLDDHNLSGFTIWRSRDGAENVTYPARPYTKGDKKEHFELLRPTSKEARERLTEAILIEYRRRLADPASAAAEVGPK